MTKVKLTPVEGSILWGIWDGDGGNDVFSLLLFARDASERVSQVNWNPETFAAEFEQAIWALEHLGLVWIEGVSDLETTYRPPKHKPGYAIIDQFIRWNDAECRFETIGQNLDFRLVFTKEGEKRVLNSLNQE